MATIIEQDIALFSQMVGAIGRIMKAMGGRGLEPAFNHLGFGAQPGKLTLSVEYRSAKFQFFCHAALVESRGSESGLEINHDISLHPLVLVPGVQLDILHLEVSRQAGHLSPRTSMSSSEIPPWLAPFAAIEANARGESATPDQVEAQALSAIADLLLGRQQ